MVEYEWKGWSDFAKEKYWERPNWRPEQDGWVFEGGAWRREKKEGARGWRQQALGQLKSVRSIRQQFREVDGQLAALRRAGIDVSKLSDDDIRAGVELLRKLAEFDTISEGGKRRDPAKMHEFRARLEWMAFRREKG